MPEKVNGMLAIAWKTDKEEPEIKKKAKVENENELITVSESKNHIKS